MGDILKSQNGMIGGQGNGASEWGLVTLRDNHGNSTIGNDLTCKGRATIQMTPTQSNDLHDAIAPSAERAWNLHGEIPLGDLESPLQTLCRQIDAENRYQAQQHRTRHR
ncbi:MAG: hypothetical protein ACREHE_07025 [Rhizomicrobium sp.]